MVAVLKQEHEAAVAALKEEARLAKVEHEAAVAAAHSDWEAKHAEAEAAGQSALDAAVAEHENALAMQAAAHEERLQASSAAEVALAEAEAAGGSKHSVPCCVRQTAKLFSSISTVSRTSTSFAFRATTPPSSAAVPYATISLDGDDASFINGDGNDVAVSRSCGCDADTCAWWSGDETSTSHGHRTRHPNRKRRP